MTVTIPKEKFAAFREFLAGRGYAFQARPHQEFLAKGRGAAVNLYSNGKVVIGGSSVDEQSAVRDYLERETGQRDEGSTSDSAELSALDIHQTRIGSDEVGKGDYFGPLVAAAVLASEFQAQRLKDVGVKDSKALEDHAILEIAERVRRSILVRGQWRLVVVPPSRYNILMTELGNLNRLLAWAHARAIEDVLLFNEPCDLAIADQFGDPKYIQDALMAKGRRIRLVQTPHGERDVVVATASVLARQEFLNQMEALGAKYGERFPLGASRVEDFARDLVKKHGDEILLDTAKLHFATTARIVTSVDSLNEMLRARIKSPPPDLNRGSR